MSDSKKRSKYTSEDSIINDIIILFKSFLLVPSSDSDISIHENDFMFSKRTSTSKYLFHIILFLFPFIMKKKKQIRNQLIHQDKYVNV
jgi:hypothetical protein